ncbi:hypothetical protein BGZ83_010255 [Gryganskiella cystojenkinii]|nr:hypothetical protein BGZ83_010255 [Gryganskiella cystojenkinii]
MLNQGMKVVGSDQIQYLKTVVDYQTGQRYLLWKEIEKHYGRQVLRIIRDGSVLNGMTDDSWKIRTPIRIAHEPLFTFEVLLGGPIEAGTGSSFAPEYMHAIEETIEMIRLRHDNLFQSLSGYQQQEERAGIDDTLLALTQNIESLSAQLSIISQNLDTVALNQSVYQREVVRLYSKLSTQVYDLLESPCPRRFIAIKTPRRGLASESFQLYFLCEGGPGSHDDVGSAGGNIANSNSDITATANTGLHLASHEGYRIRETNAFFQKFGPYLLRLMQVLRVGAFAAGLVIPVLAHVNPVDWLASFLGCISYDNQAMSTLMDKTIEHLKVKLDADNIDISGTLPEPPAGPELRQLIRFLHLMDNQRVFARLLSYVCPMTGHIKWACKTHCNRENYGVVHLDEIRRRVHMLKGGFDQLRGKITVKLSKRGEAQSFTDLLIKAPRINDLHILLGWNPTIADLEMLVRNIVASQNPSLTLDGGLLGNVHFKNIHQPGGRHDPLLGLFASEIQFLRLQGFKGLFTEMTEDRIRHSPHLRTLHIHYNVPAKISSSARQNATVRFRDITHREGRLFLSILLNCPRLTELSFETEEPNTFLDGICEIASLLHLSTIRMKGTLGEVIVLFSKNDFSHSFPEPTAIEVHTSNLDRLPNDREFMMNRRITKLSLLLSLGRFHENSLQRVLENSSSLKTVDFESALRFYPSLIRSFQTVLAKVRRTNVTLDIQLVLQQPQSGGGGSANRKGEGFRVTMDLLFRHGSQTPEKTVDVQMTGSGKLEDLDVALQDAQIRHLVANQYFTLEQAKYFRPLIGNATSKLQTMCLNPDGLVEEGVQIMACVIESSHELYDLTLQLGSLHASPRRNQARDLLRSGGNKVKSLLLQGSTPATTDLAWLSSLALNRSQVPKMTYFSLSLGGRSTPQPLISPAVMRAIIDLIQAPIENHDDVTAQTTSSSSVLGGHIGNFVTSISGSCAIQSLETVCFNDLSFTARDWSYILNELDVNKLKILDVRGTNFGPVQMDILTGLFPERRPGQQHAVLPFQELHVDDTDLADVARTTPNDYENMVDKFARRIDNVQVFTSHEHSFLKT